MATAGGLSGWVTETIDSVGELGVGVLMTLENVIPVIPSEVVLPFAGYQVARGELDAVLTWVAATAGALVGAYVLYAVGATIGIERARALAAKPWFFLFSPSDLARGERLFERHGSQLVLFGRFLPLVRSVVSVPAGLAHMALWRFTALTLVGAGLWNALFLYVGYQLAERWERVQLYLQPVGVAVAVALGVGLLVLVARRRQTEQVPRR